MIRDAEEALEGVNAAPLSGHVVFLLYLNDKTFLDVEVSLIDCIYGESEW